MEFDLLLGLSKETFIYFIDHCDNTHKIGRPSKLSASNEVLLLLVYLRHACVDILLGTIFNISKKTAGNIRHCMINLFYNWFKDRITLQTLEWRLQHSVKIFHTTYTFILDGTEQPVYGSNNPFKDIQFYSAKKSRHTINILLVISAVGKRILYLSHSVGGNQNDSDLVEATREQWYNKLDEMEFGLGDSIFEGILNGSVWIDTLPSRKNKFYSVFSKYRSQVENVIADLKDWSALKLPLRMSIANNDILSYHNKIWTIVAVFYNDFKK